MENFIRFGTQKYNKLKDLSKLLKVKDTIQKHVKNVL
jgi:hypothetical protein